MNPAELPLRDIHLPTAVSWWPPAPAWWVAAALLVLAAALAIRAWRRRRAWRRSALYLAQGEFSRLRAGWDSHGDAHRLAGELSSWLRRVAMSLRSREQAASLTGARWWAYLDELAGHSVFGPDGGQMLTEAPYRPAAEVDPQWLLSLCERWLTAVTERTRGASA